MRFFTTSQLFLLLFLVIYTIIITYYLSLVNEKNHLKEDILQENIQKLQQEYIHLTKTIKWIRDHPDEKINYNESIHESTTKPIIENKPQITTPIHPIQATIQATIKPTESRGTKKSPAVLVVGGTDGSGTRRVVQLLTNLGVLIVSEDPETYDIHADLFGGWPKVVAPVLEAAGSITYDIKDLPSQLQSSTESNLRRLLVQAEQDSHKPESKTLAVGGALPTPPDTHASNVLYGFKAPVAMTLVPWWRKLNPHFMFLHVLRDGRDIAFSANQGPVVKFYQPMYKKQPEKLQYPASVKAIQLWSDWNNGIKKWAEKQQTMPSSSDSSFRYLSLHIEDLVDESRDIRYQAIKRIADFVGSDLDDDSLCCLSAQGSKFMGSHDREGRIGANAEQTLKKKFGKWKSLLAANPTLESQLMKVGGDALKDLGYTSPNPQTSLSSSSSSSSSSCLLTVPQCNSKAAGNRDWRKAVTSPPIQSYASKYCTTEYSTDYPGGDLSVETGVDLDGCCKTCRETSRCRAFTFNLESNTCYLKVIRDKMLRIEHNKDHLVSGQVLGG